MLAGRWQAPEQVLVQAFVAQPADQALDEAVLHRLARRDVVPGDATLLLPAEDRVRGQLGAVVADDHAAAGRAARRSGRAHGRRDGRRASVSATSARHSRLKSSTTTSTRKRRPSLSTSEAKSRLQRWFGALRDRHRRPRAERPLAAAALPDRQPLLAIEPEQASCG